MAARAVLELSSRLYTNFQYEAERRAVSLRQLHTLLYVDRKK